MFVSKYEHAWTSVCVCDLHVNVFENVCVCVCVCVCLCVPLLFVLINTNICLQKRLSNFTVLTLGAR